ncbi:DUF551 domain-containing protein [Salmonella enterica]|nr:DUF551 domain-containing protein [Salmonella enterica]
MTTITKERIELFVKSPLENGLTRGEQMELARIALASLDAEPVGEVSDKRHGLVMDGTVDLGGKSTYRIIKGEKAMKRLPLGTKFYIAPPAPVAPDGLRQALSNAGIAAPESDEMLAATSEKYIQMLVTWVKDRKPFQPVPVVPEEITDESTEQRLMGRRWAHSFCAGWNACRAAMLQSKYRDLSQPVDPQISEYEKIMLRAGNSPVTPDGYTLVPVEPTDEMIAAAMDCEDVLFNSDESFCVQFGNIYEAMLAAAPQHEVK